MQRSVVLGFLFLSLCFIPLAFAQEEEVPAGVTINQLNYGGTGCPSGSVGVLLAEDAQALTLLFDDYAIESTGSGGGPSAAANSFDRRGPSQPGRPGAGGRPGHGGGGRPGPGGGGNPGHGGGRPGSGGGGGQGPKNEKSCTVQLSLNAPAGWAYSLMAVQIRGYAHIDAGAWGTQSAAYRIGTNGGQRELSRLRIDGPYDDDYQQVFDLPIKNLQWSACTAGMKGLRLDTRIMVNTPKNTTALMTVDSMDGSLSQEYSVIWRRCEGNDPTRPRPGKGYTASCKVLHPGRDGHSREFLSWGRGSTPQLAQQRAQEKAMNRCHRGNRGEGNCKVAANSCQSTEM